jgi:hypothetical protein
MYTCIYTVHSCEHLNDSDRKSYNTNNLHKQSSIVGSKKTDRHFCKNKELIELTGDYVTVL